jgi:hypothetical protein
MASSPRIERNEMSIKQAIEALEELVEYAETAGFDWSLDNARAALAALRSMPAEPVATIRYERGTPGKENDMPKVVSCNWLPDGVYSVYATQHTEAVRMSEAEIDAITKAQWGEQIGAMYAAYRAYARAVEQATAARLGVKMGDV